MIFLRDPNQDRLKFGFALILPFALASNLIIFSAFFNVKKAHLISKNIFK